MNERKRWLVVVLFALAMAWVESAVVYYLRTMIGRIEPYQPNPLPIFGGLGKAELIREAATLVMLATAGWLAGWNFRARFAYFLIAFGVWDIGYYIFLKLLTGWPNSLLDWDILFLLPLPWWGPVLAPTLIAALMVGIGTLITQTESCARQCWPRARDWWASVAGAALALFVFMQDALQAARGGETALRELLPETFNWPLFLPALGLMAVPLLGLLGQAFAETGSGPSLNCRRWLRHFRSNRENRPEPDWTAPITMSPARLAAMLPSLEQFRLGDGGGPASLIAANAESFRGQSEELRAIVDHWFAEEAEHARLLGCAVKRFGGRHITSHWSFSAFCACRRVLGVRFELQVLLLTELVSTGYYRVLRRHADDEPVRAMCSLILRDEAGHVAFHRDRLATDGRARGWLWRMQFWACGHAAATVLWMSHGRCLTTLGGSRGEFFREIRFEIGRFIRRFAKARREVVRENDSSHPERRVNVPAVRLSV
jgi:hypothetical protein